MKKKSGKDASRKSRAALRRKERLKRRDTGTVINLRVPKLYEGVPGASQTLEI